MNRLVKRGLSAYRIFLKNKFMSSAMMLVFGIMMLIAALNGRGNDTLTLPIMITLLGGILSLWSAYRLGYLKSLNDKNKKRERLLQFLETLLYVVITALGVFLLVNQEFTDKVLNLMAGFFTTLNGVFGVVNTYKGRETKDFRWKFVIVLTILELILGPYFILSSDAIDINSYIVMGTLTTVAGVAEIIAASTREGLRDTVSDGKKMIHIIKDGKEENTPEESL